MKKNAITRRDKMQAASLLTFMTCATAMDTEVWWTIIPAALSLLWMMYAVLYSDGEDKA